ncbi:hypothetical protein K7X08_014965 [Anisodus acutangulus]|uniref:Uncharacterized protein n=1 Tax=Anisodus acutangulus TaxID=402998 RepID=A0A9Q1L3L5_9SOLA|nr:hypothetical protein K7X08_014965 [Anisodus acutangulus]
MVNYPNSINKGKSQQSREGRVNENLKKPGNASELNKVDTNKADEDKKYKSLVITNDVVTTKDWVEKTFGSYIQDVNIADNNDKESNNELDDMKNDDVTHAEVVQSSLEDQEQSHIMSNVVEDAAIHAEVSSDQEVGGGANVTPLSEVNMKMVEQVSDGKIMEKEVEEIEEDVAINLDSEIRNAEIITSPKLNLCNDEKHMGDQMERGVDSGSDTPVKVHMPHNAEVVSNINVEVSVEKEIIEDVTSLNMEDISNNVEAVILSNEESLNEGSTVADIVDMKISTSGDITGSPINESLKTNCYPHSNGDSKIGQISAIADSLVMKENVNTMSVLRKSSPNKELHALVSHDMNSLDSDSKEDAMKKGDCQSSDMKKSEEENSRQRLIDVCK